MNNEERNVAIVLAGGRGSRMKSEIPKQYMNIFDKPVLYYSLKAFQDSFIDDIILVAGEDDIDFCNHNVVEKYNLTKVSRIVAGGPERYNSVYNGIKAISEFDSKKQYIYIHDGARPCVNNDILLRNRECVREYKACVTAVQVKDTIKIVDIDGFAILTPDRNTLWQIQTPQVFEYALIKEAYEKMLSDRNACNITDDAMVVEGYSATKVKMCEGDYTNIKLTTPEDLEVIKNILKK